MAENLQKNLDMEKARISASNSNAPAGAMQGLEFEEKLQDPNDELAALENIQNATDIGSRVAAANPPPTIQNANQEIANKKAELGLASAPGDTAVAQAPEVVSTEQLATAPVAGAPAPQQTQPQEIAPINKVMAKMEQAAQAGKVAAAEQTSYVDSYAKEMEKKQLVDDQMRKERQDEIDNKIQLAQTHVEKVANGEIDPSRVFSNMSNFQKFGTVLLAGLAGNKGIDVLNRMVEQDVNAQVANRNSKLDAAKGKVSMYQEFRDKLKDDELAKQATRAAQYQVAQMKLEAIQNQTKNAQVAATIQNQIGELELKKQEIVGKFSARANEMAAMQGAGIDPVTAKIYGLPDAVQKPLLEAKEVYDATNAAFSTIDTIFNEAKGIGGIAGNIPFSDKKAQVEANSANIESAIRATMKGQGTIQEAEISRLVMPLLPKPTDTNSVIDIKKAKLKQLLNTKNAGQIGRLKNLGLIPKEFSPTSAKKN